MRLIDADALIKWVQECGEKCPTLSVEKLFNKIKSAPTIDAVPVVRCKDCKHAQIDTIFDAIWCNGESIVPEGFCEKGELR